MTQLELELTRTDHLRMYALQRATTFLNEAPADEARKRVIADADAYYAFLSNNDDTP